MTTGGDHGPPFVPASSADDESGGDDGGTGVLPQEDDDPTGWEYDSASGIYYRRTTENEREKNRWIEGSLLVVDSAFLSDALSAETYPTLAFPLALGRGETPSDTLDIVSVDLELRRESELAAVVSMVGGSSGTSTATVSRPKFLTYFPYDAAPTDPAPNDALARIVVEKGKGLSGTVGLEDRRVVVRGPFIETSNVTVLDIDPPVGDDVLLVDTSILDDPWFFAGVPARPSDFTFSEQARAGTSTDISSGTRPALGDDGRAAQCADGLDNDPDGAADNCDYDCVAHPDYGGNNFDHVRGFEYTKNIGVMSDITLCSCAPEACGAMVFDVAEHAAGLLNALNPPANPSVYSLDTKAPPLRVRLYYAPKHSGGCGAAEACDANTDGAGCPSDYVFRTAGGDLDVLRTLAWEGVDAAATAIEASPVDLHPVSLAGVIAAVNSTSDGGESGYDVNSGFYNLGAAAIHYNVDNDDEDILKDVGFNGQRLAHEFGHCFGLRHDDAVAVQPVQPGSVIHLNGFMHVCPGPVPILGGTPSGTVFIDNKSNWEIWATEPWSPVFPRPSGFSHTGCTEHAECQSAGFPGLVCAGEGMKKFCGGF